MKQPEIEHFMNVIENHIDLDPNERQLIHEESNTMYNKLIDGKQEMTDALTAHREALYEYYRGVGQDTYGKSFEEAHRWSEKQIKDVDKALAKEGLQV